MAEDSSGTPSPPPLGKAAHNEQLKLLATSLNAVGLAAFAIGGLQPLFAGSFSAARVLAALGSVISLLALHMARDVC